MPGSITIKSLYDSTGEVTIAGGKATVQAGYIEVVGTDDPEVRGMMGWISGDENAPHTVDNAYDEDPKQFSITWDDYTTTGAGQTLKAYDPNDAGNYDEIELEVV